VNVDFDCPTKRLQVTEQVFLGVFQVEILRRKKIVENFADMQIS